MRSLVALLLAGVLVAGCGASDGPADVEPGKPVSLEWSRSDGPWNPIMHPMTLTAVGNEFVVTGESWADTAAMWTSSDGTDWTEHPLPSEIANHDLYVAEIVGYGDDYLLIGRDGEHDGAGDASLVWHSSAESGWQRLDTGIDGSDPIRRVAGVATCDSTIVMALNSWTDLKSERLLVSLDGESLIETSPKELSPTEVATGIEEWNDRFLLTTWDPTTDMVSWWESLDGIAWGSLTTEDSIAADVYVVDDAVWDDRIVAITWNDRGTGLWIYSDGTWTEVDPEAFAIGDGTKHWGGEIAGIAAGGLGALLQGWGHGSPDSDGEAFIWFSADGHQWTRQTVAEDFDPSAKFIESFAEVGVGVLDDRALVLVAGWPGGSGVLVPYLGVSAGDPPESTTTVEVPIPDVASLVDEPDPAIPGVVAFTRSDGRCIFIVEASGGPERQVGCYDFHVGFGFGDGGWTADGLLVTSGLEEMFLIEPDTGEVVETATLFGSGWPGRERLPDGTIIEAVPGKPQLRQIGADGTTTTILSLDGPDGYYLVGPEWSPDASWIFVRDSEERLIIVAAQGDPNPRVLAQGVTTAAWHIAGYDTSAIIIPSRD